MDFEEMDIKKLEAIVLADKAVRDRTLKDVLDAIVLDKERTDGLSKEDDNNYPKATAGVLVAAMSAMYMVGYDTGKKEALKMN